jgi:hypothetical protein
VREFDRDTVAGLIRLSRAIRADDESHIQAALSAIGMPKPAVDFEVTRRLLRGFFDPLLTPGRHAVPADRALAVGETVSIKRKLMRMRLPGKLMFLFRIRFGLYAVLSRIGAESDWVSLEDELAGDICR